MANKGERRGGMDWEIGIDIYAPSALGIKSLMRAYCSSREPAQCFVVT